MEGRALDFVALGILITVVITILYAVIYIHDIPYEIAKKRNHPHQDALHTAGWVSLFLMHTIWPCLWIWATLYKPETGWGMAGGREKATIQDDTTRELIALKARVSALEQKLEAALEQKPESPVEEA
jgi:hypothetical protein